MPDTCVHCARVVDEVVRRRPLGPVCTACYQSQYSTVSCNDCGAPTRSYHGMQPAQCRHCLPREALKCLRCGHAVTAQRSFRVPERDGRPGGWACTACRSRYEPLKTCLNCGSLARRLCRAPAMGFLSPVCDKCRSSRNETCSGCRKHRAVVARRADGAPLCSKCATGEPFVCSECHQAGTRHSATTCSTCYYRGAVTAEASRLAGVVTSSWARELFELFAADWLRTSVPNGYSRARMRRYSNLFVRLAETFATRQMVTAELLLKRFGADELRRLHVPYAWLVREGYLPGLPAELAAQDSESRTRARLLERVGDDWRKALLERYYAHLLEVRQAWQQRGWSGEHERFKERTVTLLLRAAKRFLDSLPADVLSLQGIDRGQLERFVVELPGHRNALHSFVEFLNRKETLFQKLHIERIEGRNFPFELLMPQEQLAGHIERWLGQRNGQTRRDALLCLFMAVYARTATQACALKRGAFSIAANGRVTASFARVAVPLNKEIAAMLRGHLAELEAERGRALRDDEFIFPGRLPGRCLSTAAMQYILRREGVNAAQLFTTALSNFYRGGLRTPKVLVKTLGVSDQTAIAYWRAFAPREIEEMEFLAGRRN